jgi:hypothetical protein
MKPYLEKKKQPQKRADGVAQGIGPEFKSQYLKKKKKNSTGHFPHLQLLMMYFSIFYTVINIHNIKCTI